MNLDWLRTLREVAGAGSYTKASEVLFLSQPAVSQQIRQLERFFGTKLVQRRGQEMQLTEAGKLVYALSCRFEVDLHATRASINSLVGGSHHVVAIASSPAPLLHLVPLALNRFWKEHPEIEVKTIVRFGPDIISAVKSGAADIGIHPGYESDSTLEARLMGVGHLLCIARPDHPLAGKELLAPDVIASQRIAITPLGTPTRKIVDDWFGARGVRLQHCLEVSSYEEIRISALKNLAIGFLGRGTVSEDLEAGRLVQLDIRDLDLSLKSYVSYRDDIQAPARWLLDALVPELPVDRASVTSGPIAN